MHGRYEVDLANHAAVTELRQLIDTERGPIDGLIHLVGGWRGGKGITGQSDDDCGLPAHPGPHHAAQHHPGLPRRPGGLARGRVAIVSATAVDAPSGSNANYTTAKAGAEAWMRVAWPRSCAPPSPGSKDNPVPSARPPSPG